MELEFACAALEAVLFAAGEPMETDRLAEALGMTPAEVESAAQTLTVSLEAQRSGLQLLQLAFRWLSECASLNGVQEMQKFVFHDMLLVHSAI